MSTSKYQKPKRQPFRHSEWIKHAYDFDTDSHPIECSQNEALILVHPAHPKVKLSLDEDIMQQIEMLPKSLQLYLFGLVWLGFCETHTEAEWRVARAIVVSIFEHSLAHPQPVRNDMVWDDHALSERVCVLTYLKELPRYGELLNDITHHLEISGNNLDALIASKKWEGNNHRVFHLCAKYCMEKYHRANMSLARETIAEIERCFSQLIDVRTGFSVEQAVAYYSFDIILLSTVSKYLSAEGESFSDARMNVTKVEENKNRHLRALAFPDGQLPASGDTPLGINIPPPKLGTDDRENLWRGLESMGHFRGSSENERFHFHVLSHDSESAHGHSSALHLDLWVEGMGMVLVDSGGPYKYGDPLRYGWFRSCKAHNTVCFEANSETCRDSLVIDNKGRSFSGHLIRGRSRFKRVLTLSDAVFSVNDRISSSDRWSLSFHFDRGLKLQRHGDVVKVERGRHCVNLSIDLQDGLDFSLTDGFVTTRGGHKEPAPCILVSGGPGDFELNFDFLRPEHISYIGSP